jgi:parvulin-like peptidyl-prolyl isomerase
MKRILYAALLAALVPALSFAQAELQPAAIVKLTKTEPITVKQLKAEIQKLETQAKRSLTKDERREVLDVLVNERLALQAADRDKIAITDNEVNQQIQQLRASMASQLKRQPTEAEFEAAVKNETGQTVAEYKDQLRRQMTVQKYVLTKKRATFEGIANPTEEDIQAEYELNKAKFLRPETVRFTMIYIPIEAGADGKAKAKQIADRLVKEIGSSANKFDEAVLKGQVAGADYRAGEGGFLPKTAEAQRVVGAEFLNTAFSLKLGEVSRLMENSQSFQIIKVTETYGQKMLELGDLYQLGTRATVRDYIGNRLLQSRQTKAVDTATKEIVDELRTGKTFQVFEQNLNW